MALHGRGGKLQYLGTSALQCMLVEGTYGLGYKIEQNPVPVATLPLPLLQPDMHGSPGRRQLFDNREALLHTSTCPFQECAKETWGAAGVGQCMQIKGSCNLPSVLVMHQGQRAGVWLRVTPAHAAVLPEMSAGWELPLQSSHEGVIGSDENLLAPLMYLPHGSLLDVAMVFSDMESAPAQQHSEAQCCHAPQQGVSAAADGSIDQHAEPGAC